MEHTFVLLYCVVIFLESASEDKSQQAQCVEFCMGIFPRNERTAEEHMAIMSALLPLACCTSFRSPPQHIPSTVTNFLSPLSSISVFAMCQQTRVNSSLHTESCKTVYANMHKLCSHYSLQVAPERPTTHLFKNNINLGTESNACRFPFLHLNKLINFHL